MFHSWASRCATLSIAMSLILIAGPLAIAGPPGGGNGVASAKRPGNPAEQPKKQAADAVRKSTGDKSPTQPEFRTGDKAIEKALSEPTQMEFIDTPLPDVIEYLKDLHHMEIQIDKKAMEEAGISPDYPVTKNLKGISLRSALTLLLSSYDLTYTIDNEVLLVTTQEKAKGLLITRLYTVGDLVAFHDTDGDWDDYDSLIDLITTTVVPTSWDAVGGPGSITGFRAGEARLLVVSASDQVQRELNAFLENIRALAKEAVKVTPTQRDRPKQQAGPHAMGSVSDPKGKDGKPAAGGMF